MSDKISVARALKNMKDFNKKLDDNKLGEIRMVAIKTGDDPILLGGIGIETFEKNVKKAFQSISDLENIRDKTSAAIAESNTLTKIRLPNNEEITVTAAIQRRKYLPQKLTRLKSNLRNLVRERDNFDDAVTAWRYAGERIIDGNVHRDRKTTKAELELQYQQHETKSKPSLIDPMGPEFIEKQIEELQAFDSEIDVLLSESNGKTMIEI